MKAWQPASGRIGALTVGARPGTSLVKNLWGFAASGDRFVTLTVISVPPKDFTPGRNDAELAGFDVRGRELWRIAKPATTVKDVHYFLDANDGYAVWNAGTYDSACPVRLSDGKEFPCFARSGASELAFSPRAEGVPRFVSGDRMLVGTNTAPRGYGRSTLRSVDGTILWDVPIEPRSIYNDGSAYPLASLNGVAIVGYGTNELIFQDLETGAVITRAYVGKGSLPVDFVRSRGDGWRSRYQPFVIDYSTGLVMYGTDGYVSVFDTKTRTVLWTTPETQEAGPEMTCGSRTWIRARASLTIFQVNSRTGAIEKRDVKDEAIPRICMTGGRALFRLANGRNVIVRVP